MIKNTTWDKCSYGNVLVHIVRELAYKDGQEPQLLILKQLKSVAHAGCLSDKILMAIIWSCQKNPEQKVIFESTWGE